MSKITLADLVNLENQTTAVNAINNNNTVLEAALTNTLSRDGTSPNQMNANLDMNSNHILNLPAPISADEPVRLTDIQDLTAGGTIVFNSIPVGGTTGQVLIKNSASNYDVSWKNPTPVITPEMYGAVASPYGTAASSIADSTAAFTSALAVLTASQGGSLQLGVGVYKITSGLTIGHHNIHIVGQGERASLIIFQPSTSSSCLTFSQVSSPGDVTINNCGISSLTIASSDTTYSKNAINLVDVSNFTIDDVTVSHYVVNGTPFGDSTHTSTGLRINGRELGRVRNFTVYADYPLIIAPNPNNAISLDSWTFDNCNFVAHLDTSNSNPCIFVLDNTNLFNVQFGGSQNWQGGTNGFQWINTTASQASYNISFSGVKGEQCQDVVAGTTAYTFFISSNNVIRGLDIDNSEAGDRNGIYLRNVINPRISGFVFDPVISNLRGLDVDSTAGTLTLEGCTWLTTTTASISGLNAIQTSDTPTGLFLSTAIPPRGFYSTKSVETFSNVNVNDVNSTGSASFYSGTTPPAGGTAGLGLKFSATPRPNFGIFFGSGVPTLSAAQGSLYIRTDGSSTSTRLYVNSNNTTGWTNVTTAA